MSIHAWLLCIGIKLKREFADIAPKYMMFKILRTFWISWKGSFHFKLEPIFYRFPMFSFHLLRIIWGAMWLHNLHCIMIFITSDKFREIEKFKIIKIIATVQLYIREADSMCKHRVFNSGKHKYNSNTLYCKSFS